MNPRTGKVASFYTLKGIPQETLEAGGILPLLKRKVEEAKAKA